MSYSPQQLSDLQCIRDVALRYCRGVDRLDAVLMKSACWPEATDDHGGFKGNAIAATEFRQGSDDRQVGEYSLGP